MRFGGRMKLCLMVVEDEPHLRRAWARWIRRRGSDVLSVGTIEEARAASGSGADAWIVDQRLPDGLGTEPLRELRGAGSMVPILLVTGWPSLALANEAASLRAFFHTKPIDHHVIEVLLEAARGPVPLDARIAGALKSVTASARRSLAGSKAFRAAESPHRSTSARTP